MLEQWLKEILDRLDEGVHVIGEDGITVFYNQAMGRMEGLSPADVIGKSLLSHFPSLSQDTSTLYQALKTGKPLLAISQTYLNPQGERITSSNDTFPLYIGGKLVGAFEVARDWSGVARLAEQVAELRSELYPPGSVKLKKAQLRYDFTDICTQDERFLKIIEKAKRISASDVSVLISGETGTGKEMIAQSIHGTSRRARGPFIAQNCAALPESLLEGILFGTVRGSFTGALDRPGLFEQAQGGTLLLDELDSMGWNLQAKLLRVLQEGCVRRLGDTQEREIDVRFVATMNKSPQETVKEGRIRPDLYYRLNVVDISLPPLREREGDIELLVTHFLTQFAKRFNRRVPRLKPRIVEALRQHDWPGNVRELAHVIEGGLVIAEEEFGEEELPAYLQARVINEAPCQSSTKLSLPEQIENFERGLIIEALRNNNANLTRTARELGISRQLLQYKLRQRKRL